MRSTLPLLLDALHNFLSSHPKETLILSIKEEIPPFHPDFSRLIYKAFEPYISEYWFLESRIPRLGEVRGKGILLSRFDTQPGDGWDGREGIHPDWPDSRKEGFTWDCADTKVRIQDWYRVKTFLSIPDKFQAVSFSIRITTV